jgi:hypothetical protein
MWPSIAHAARLPGGEQFTMHDNSAYQAALTDSSDDDDRPF